MNDELLSTTAKSISQTLSGESSLASRELMSELANHARFGYISRECHV